MSAAIALLATAVFFCRHLFDVVAAASQGVSLSREAAAVPRSAEASDEKEGAARRLSVRRVTVLGQVLPFRALLQHDRNMPKSGRSASFRPL
jgi:hypothetical protein